MGYFVGVFVNFIAFLLCVIGTFVILFVKNPSLVTFTAYYSLCRGFVNWRLCVVLVTWRPACVDLPTLTWTPSVPIAASSLALCVSALIWNPSLYCRMDGLWLCWGRQPSSLSISSFFPSQAFSVWPCNYRPACREGLTTWFGRQSCSAVSLSLSLSVFPSTTPPKPFRPPAPIIQRLPADGPIWWAVQGFSPCSLRGRVWSGFR